MGNITSIKDIYSGDDLISFIGDDKEKFDEVVKYIRELYRVNAALVENKDKWRVSATKRKEQLEEYKAGEKCKTTGVDEYVKYDYKDDKPRVIFKIETDIPSNQTAVDYIRHTEGLEGKDFINEFPVLKDYLPVYETADELIDRCLRDGIPLEKAFPLAMREVKRTLDKKVTDKDIIDSLRKDNGKIFISDNARKYFSMDRSHNIRLERAFKEKNSWVIEISVEVRKKIL